MADSNFQGPGTNPVYNSGGTLRLPHITEPGARQIGVVPQIWSDVSTPRHIDGGLVAPNFVALELTPLKLVAGLYVVADMATEAALVVGLLMAATDCGDGEGREINIIKGGSVNSYVGYLYGKDATACAALATALGGKYDAQFKRIRF